MKLTKSPTVALGQLYNPRMLTSTPVPAVCVTFCIAFSPVGLCGNNKAKRASFKKIKKLASIFSTETLLNHKLFWLAKMWKEAEKQCPLIPAFLFLLVFLASNKCSTNNCWRLTQRWIMFFMLGMFIWFDTSMHGFLQVRFYLAAKCQTEGIIRYHS